MKKRVLRRYMVGTLAVSIGGQHVTQTYNTAECTVTENISKKAYVANIINNVNDESMLSHPGIGITKLEQEAVKGLKQLTPLLSDVSINYSGLVTSSLPDAIERNLLDGDTETFTGDLFSADNYFILDFSKDYKISTEAFKIQSRKYFLDRIWKNGLEI